EHGSRALIEGVEKSGSAQKTECPDHRDAARAAQSSQRNQGQQRSNEIAICGWHRESGWQFGRDNTLHQEYASPINRKLCKRRRGRFLGSRRPAATHKAEPRKPWRVT